MWHWVWTHSNTADRGKPWSSDHCNFHYPAPVRAGAASHYRGHWEQRGFDFYSQQSVRNDITRGFLITTYRRKPWSHSWSCFEQEAGVGDNLTTLPNWTALQNRARKLQEKGLERQTEKVLKYSSTWIHSRSKQNVWIVTLVEWQ